MYDPYQIADYAKERMNDMIDPRHIESWRNFAMTRRPSLGSRLRGWWQRLSAKKAAGRPLKAR